MNFCLITGAPNNMQFEPYDSRMGCVAVNYNGYWWVVKPNGTAEMAHGMTDANSKAHHLNATATPEEREAWKND